MNKPLLLLLALLVIAPLSLAKVNVDWDQGFAWGSVESYGWMKSADTEVNDLAHRRIVAVVERYMSEFGLTLDPENPDVWITYHGSTQDEVVVDVSTYGYGYPSTMYWGPYTRGYYGSSWDATATTRTYTEGTLVIDVLDADEKQLIWRGTATGTIPDSTKKREKALNRAVAKMAKKWDSLRRKAAKQARKR